MSRLHVRHRHGRCKKNNSKDGAAHTFPHTSLLHITPPLCHFFSRSNLTFGVKPQHNCFFSPLLSLTADDDEFQSPLLHRTSPPCQNPKHVSYPNLPKPPRLWYSTFFNARTLQGLLHDLSHAVEKFS